MPDLNTQLALLYKRWVLDCVVMSAFAVSKDFSQRPELYQNVGGDVPAKLTALQSRYGYDGDFPNCDQRNMLLTPIFGLSDGGPKVDTGSAFFGTRQTVIGAATDYSENAQPTGFPMLRERVRSALVPFRTFLRDREGDSLTETHRRIESLFDVAETILKNENVRIVFGINKDIDGDWPLNSTDPNGAKLIEKITLQLSDIPVGQVSLDRFVRLQRVAEKGADAIRSVIGEDVERDDEKLATAIANFYAWGSDLEAVKADLSVARNKVPQR
jgi:hypothetical protein